MRRIITYLVARGSTVQSCRVLSGKWAAQYCTIPLAILQEAATQQERPRLHPKITTRKNLAEDMTFSARTLHFLGR